VSPPGQRGFFPPPGSPRGFYGAPAPSLLGKGEEIPPRGPGFSLGTRDSLFSPEPPFILFLPGVYLWGSDRNFPGPKNPRVPKFLPGFTPGAPKVPKLFNPPGGTPLTTKRPRPFCPVFPQPPQAGPILGNPNPKFSPGLFGTKILSQKMAFLTRALSKIPAGPPKGGGNQTFGPPKGVKKPDH